MIPQLETPRLHLRGHVAGDFDDCFGLWTDPVVTRFIGGRPSTGEEVWARMLRYAGLWGLLGFGYWHVSCRETGRFVGEVGLADFRRSLQPGFGSAPEAGWALASWAHGRGLAREAVTAVLNWADGALPAAPHTVCMIDPENAPSRAIARHVGFQPDGETMYKDHPVLLFRRPRLPPG